MQPDATACAVFADSSRHTCIRVAEGLKYIEFIPMDPVDVSIKRMPTAEFKREYLPMADYPVKRAAESYLFHSDSKTIAPKAREHLEAIIGNPKFDYDSSQFKTEINRKETTMATAKKTPAPAAKKTKATVAAAPAKKAAAPAAKKAKAAPAEATAPRGRAGAVPLEGKITILAESNPKRGASADRFALYKKNMTVADYIAAGGQRADINWDIKAGFISVA